MAGESLTVNVEGSDYSTDEIWRVFSSSAVDSSKMKLCVRDGSDGLQNAPTFLVSDGITSAEEFSCVTDSVLTSQFFAVEVKIQIKREGAKAGSYRLALSTRGTCSDPISSSEDLTLNGKDVLILLSFCSL